jgi:hypothetical protein
MIGFVYLWTNNVNDKKYIGLHAGSEDDGYVGSGTVFRRAVEKHGIENFSRIILHREYESLWKLYEAEYNIINEHNAVHDQAYYNLTSMDPKCQIGPSTRVITEDTRQSMRLAARNRPPVSDSTRMKMSTTRKGLSSPIKGKLGATIGTRNGMYGRRWHNDGVHEVCCIEADVPAGWIRGRLKSLFLGKNNPFYGKRHSTESRKRISSKNTGKLLGDLNPAKRPEIRAKISAATTGKAKTKHETPEAN